MAEQRTISIPSVVGGGYADFWHCRKRYRVVKGGKASKKSTTAALWFIVHLMKYPQANLLVVRQVYATLADSAFAQLNRAIDRLGVRHLWQATRSPLEIKYKPTGQRILFRGFDDPDKLASTTVEKGVICWVWVEEAFDIRSEEAFDRLDLSMPRGIVKPPLFKQTTLTFNPWNENHWLKKRFFDAPRDDTFTMTSTYLCNEFLDDTDRRIYERMKIEQPQKYAVAGLGEWGVSEGLVFERWRVEAFDETALPYPDRLRFVFGLDYGYSHDPTAFIAMAVDPQARVLYVYDEHYEKRMLNSDIAQMIVRKGYAKERIRADAAEPKSNDELRRLGLSRVTAAAKGPDSVRAGIAALQEYTMIVHPKCVHTAAELAAYVWDAKSGGRTPVDDNNHLMDAMRYAMEDVRFRKNERRTEKPPRSKFGIVPQDFIGGWA